MTVLSVAAEFGALRAVPVHEVKPIGRRLFIRYDGTDWDFAISKALTSLGKTRRDFSGITVCTTRLWRRMVAAVENKAPGKGFRGLNS